LFAVCALAGFSAAAFGQTSATPAPVISPQQPFTAEFKTVSVKMLADGTTITREATTVRAVNSQSRIMSAITRQGSGGRGIVTTVSTYDPVAGERPNWNSLSKQATVWKKAAGESCETAATKVSPVYLGPEIAEGSVATLSVVDGSAR
jgi:hypothetical protein